MCVRHGSFSCDGCCVYAIYFQLDCFRIQIFLKPLKMCFQRHSIWYLNSADTLEKLEIAIKSIYLDIFSGMQMHLANTFCRPNAPIRRHAHQCVPVCQAAKETRRLLRDGGCCSYFLQVFKLTYFFDLFHDESAAMQQPKQGGNLTFLAAGNYLRVLGISNQADVTRILDILTNKNSLFGTKGGKQPINPYVSYSTNTAD